jgi:hypothetical protein
MPNATTNATASATTLATATAINVEGNVRATGKLLAVAGEDGWMLRISSSYLLISLTADFCFAYFCVCEGACKTFELLQVGLLIF